MSKEVKIPYDKWLEEFDRLLIEETGSDSSDIGWNLPWLYKNEYVSPAERLEEYLETFG